MTPEDTPRMAERTDRQEEQDVTRLVMARLLDVLRDNFDDNAGRTHFEDCWRAHAPCAIRKAHDLLAARAADAVLLRERDAQIASLTKAVQGNALAVVKANDAASQQIASLTAQVKEVTGCPHDGDCACAVATRHEAFDWFCGERDANITLRAERDALLAQRRESRSWQNLLELKQTTAERDAAQQENQTLREALQTQSALLLKERAERGVTP